MRLAREWLYLGWLLEKKIDLLAECMLPLFHWRLLDMPVATARWFPSFILGYLGYLLLSFVIPIPAPLKGCIVDWPIPVGSQVVLILSWSTWLAWLALASGPHHGRGGMVMVRFEPGDPGMFQMKLHNGSHELFGLTGKSLETWHHHASSVLKYKTNGQSLK